MERIFSPGKLLLTSEYFVLDGSVALALPTKLGQEFFYEQMSEQNSILYWKALHQKKEWLTITIDYKNWEILETNLETSARFILNTLKNIEILGSEIFKTNNNLSLTTNLQFPSNYGLGSSSTLMTNLAKWAGVDAFRLNSLSLGGSGYDIAVAKTKKPILFWNENTEPHYQIVNFDPIFSEDLIFIHLNKKQDSREGIELYRSKEKMLYLVRRFSEITQSVLDCKSLESFSGLMQEHESLLSGFLGIPSVKELYFEDCPSFVKSLGAWGGDFVMSVKFENYKKYFQEKGFDVVVDWESMIDS